MKRPRLKDYPAGDINGYLNGDGSIKFHKYVTALNNFIDFQDDESKKERRTNWKLLREKYFNKCTYYHDGLRKVLLSPHDLFEWFKKNIK